jgi:hypothetical protein
VRPLLPNERRTLWRSILALVQRLARERDNPARIQAEDQSRAFFHMTGGFNGSDGVLHGLLVTNGTCISIDYSRLDFNLCEHRGPGQPQYRGSIHRERG